jgi:hypothetical protein
MAPKFDQLATILSPSPDLIVARMDITLNKIPLEGQDAGFAVDSFPSMYLVRPRAEAGEGEEGEGVGQKLVLDLYKFEGEKEVKPVLKFVKHYLENVDNIRVLIDVALFDMDFPDL